jgi:hypothetical protein
MLFEEWLTAAAGDTAFDLALWTGGEMTQPTEISIGLRLEQEDVRLMMRNADVALGKQTGERLGTCPPQLAQPVEPGQPDREVDVLALMRNFDTESVEPPGVAA